jgi:hypothetical protein
VETGEVVNGISVAREGEERMEEGGRRIKEKPIIVIPAQARIHFEKPKILCYSPWILTFVRMTDKTIIVFLHSSIWRRY